MILVAKKRTLLIILIAVVLVGAIVGTVCAVAANATPANKFVIVIDAGHGGLDNGVIGPNGMKEQDFNLIMSQQLKADLEGAGFKVVMTRKNGEGLYKAGDANLKKSDMAARKKIVEQSKCDMLISVHANKFPDKTRRGAQVFCDPSSVEGAALALHIQAGLNVLNREKLDKEYQHQTGDYFMLKCTKAPSVIVECGFMSNVDDADLLANESYRTELSFAILAGVISYINTRV